MDNSFFLNFSKIKNMDLIENLQTKNFNPKNSLDFLILKKKLEENIIKFNLERETKINILKNEVDYNNIIPLKEEMNIDTQCIPKNYSEIYNINTYHKQDFIGNKKYLNKKKEINYIPTNSSFKSVPIPPHVNV